MAEDAVVQIAYNRKALGRLIAVYSVLCVLLLPMIVLIGIGVFYLAHTKSWLNLILSFLGLLEAIFFIFGVPYLFASVSNLRQSQQHDEPAFIINKTGIVDHASGYRVGQLAWNEIQKMYLWTDERRLVSNRFFKTPVVAKYRMVVIVMKDRSYLERLPRFTAFQIKIDNRCRHGRVVFVPEYILEVTTDELMRQLNDFYTTEVKGAA